MNNKIIELIQSRLDIGAKKYNEELDINDGRDWEVETLEELLDACVYLTSRILQLKEKKIEKVKLEPKETELIVEALQEMSSNLYISGENEKSTNYSELSSKISMASNHKNNE